MNHRASKSSDGAEVRPDGPDTGPIAFDDDALVEGCRKGDMKAFGHLVAKYQGRVFNLMVRMTGHHAQAEDLAQEAFLRAMERIGQFRGRSSFYTWVFRIAANLAISHRRRVGRVRFRSLAGPDGPAGSQADNLTASIAARRDSGPTVRANHAEVRQRVEAALEEIDDELRLVVILRDMEEMDYSQIARVIDAPMGTVKSRLHRARSLLREKLADLT